MSAVSGRLSASRILRAVVLIALAAFFPASYARAVIVRGLVTDPLGRPVAGAHVQLVQGSKSVANAVTGPDGTYEIRYAAAGRFSLLTSAATFYPGVGEDFYGGSTDVLAKNVVLEVSSVHQVVSVTATGRPTPLEQTSSPITLIPQSDLLTQYGIVNDLRQGPGVQIVQTGQAGGVTSMFMRGGNSTANKVLIDGIPANDVGGTFDFGTVSTTGLSTVEIYRGPNSALYGSDAEAAVVNFVTPRGNSMHPVLNYSGDAGNFHTYRNEAVLSGTERKLDYLAGFSRFDTSNALARDRYHSATSVANLGYELFPDTQVRFTLRNAVSASGLPSAHDFYGISADAKQADQDIYSGVTVENRWKGNLHNLVRYGIARKREQEQQFTNVGTPITFNFGEVPCTDPAADCFTEYFGNVMTIRGANGYKATGQASFFVPNEDSDSNRDELYYQTDYTFPKHITALFGFRYENERGSYVTSYENESIQRTNYEYTLQIQGQIKQRFFYSLGGGVDKNHLYGITGAPRVGFAYAPVIPGNGWFHGTRLRANYATGVQEPTLGIEFASLYRLLLANGDFANIAKYHVTPPGPQRSHSWDIGVDQNIYRKLVMKLGYFHNVFDHQLEGVGAGALVQDFGYSPSVADTVFTPYLNSQAFRAQGFEAELQWQATSRLFVHGGYTYLDAVVLQSFSSDASSGGTASNNPNFPDIPIGAEGPLVGARPFRRPPHTGYFDVQYVGRKLSAAIKGSLASRSDDSTFLDGFDSELGNTLVLPNRNLDFGYAKLDANFTYAFRPRITVFTQLDNLLSQQHIGPIGYPALPFTFRSGLKIRIGGD